MNTPRQAMAKTVQTKEERAASQDPKQRLKEAMAKLEALPDGVDGTARVRKRLYAKIAKLKKQLGEKMEVTKKAEKIEDTKAKLRAKVFTPLP